MYNALTGSSYLILRYIESSGRVSSNGFTDEETNGNTREHPNIGPKCIKSSNAKFHVPYITNSKWLELTPVSFIVP